MHKIYYNCRREKFLEKCSEVQIQLTAATGFLEKAEFDKNQLVAKVARAKNESAALGKKIEQMRDELRNSVESETRQTTLLATFEKRKVEVEETHRANKREFVENSKKSDEDHVETVKSLKERLERFEEEKKEVERELHRAETERNKETFKRDIVAKDAQLTQKTFDEKRAIMDEGTDSETESWNKFDFSNISIHSENTFFKIPCFFYSDEC